MNLLLDALKQTGQSRPNAAQRKPPGPGTHELTLEKLPDVPAEKTTHEAEDDLTRLYAHNLFAATPVHTMPRPGIVPLALLAGLVFAIGGSYYVWREITPAPMLQPQNPAPSPVAITAPVSIAPVSPARPPASAEPAPLVLAPKSIPAALARTSPLGEENTRPSRRVPVAAMPVLQPAAPKAPSPIRIEHGKEITTVDLTLLAAYQAYRNGELDTAKQHYGDVLQRHTKSRDALLGLAAIAQQQSQDELAALYYRQVLALDPRDPIAHAGMSALVGTADTTGTESRLKLLLSQQPQSAALYFALGNHYAEQSRWGEAQQAYFEAASREPDNGHFAFNLAVSLDHLGQRKLAGQHYQRALQLSPSGDTGFNREQVQQRAHELVTP